MAADFIRKESIRLRVNAHNWEEAVRAVGRLMYQSGLVEEGYIDAMVDCVKQLGPYIVLAPGIALPHARPEDGGLKVGIGLITLSEAVPFGNVDNDPVDVVIGLASNDTSSHMGLLAQLSNFLEEEANIDFLRKAVDEETVFTFLNNYGKEEVQ